MRALGRLARMKWPLLLASLSGVARTWPHTRPYPGAFPRSASGVRWVSIPPFLLRDVIEHLEQFTGTADDQLVLTGPKGAQLRRSNFTRQWRKALEAAGMTGIHVHDLRHTGNTLAGEAGASLRELMDRMGHSTTRAALIYQHRTSLRDKMIGDEISRRAEAERLRSDAPMFCQGG
jgi:integrase